LPIENRARLRLLALLAAVLSLALIASCGDDDDDSDADGGDTAAAAATSVEIGLSGSGKAVSFSVPENIQAGLTELSIDNTTKRPQDLQLIKVEGDHSEQEVVKAFQEVGSGKPIPDWFLAGGGVGTTEPGQSRSVTQVLEPGTYYGFSTEGPLAYTAIEVGGEAADGEVPEADATVSAFEYGFEGEGLKAGRQQIRFENTGAQPHHIVAAPILGDATFEEVKKFMSTEEAQGRPPVNFDATTSTAVIEGGASQLTDLELQSGRYAFVCFISDRQGGPPHVAKGMITEVEVE
jgi:hypothetical protein